MDKQKKKMEMGEKKKASKKFETT